MSQQAYEFHLTVSSGIPSFLAAVVPQRIEVPADNLACLAAYIAGDRCIEGELPPDEWGELRRALIPTCRIQMIVESK